MSGVSSSATGASASMPSDRARRPVMTSRGRNRLAQRPERREAFGVETFDRQRDERFAVRDQHRTAGTELGQPTPDTDVLTGTKKNGTQIAPNFTHY